MVDVADKAPPSINAVETLGPLEHGLGRAGDHTAEEAPKRCVHVEDLVVGEPHTDGLLEEGDRDDLVVHRLGPAEDIHQHWRAGDEVALHATLPLDTVLNPLNFMSSWRVIFMSKTGLFSWPTLPSGSRRSRGSGRRPRAACPSPATGAAAAGGR